MEGRFRKIDVSQYQFKAGGGIYCNNEHKNILFNLMKSKFGKPNGNSLRADDCTWKFVLEFREIYLTIYDFGEFWSLGFLEREDVIPDYELIYAFSRMLFNYLNEEIQAKLSSQEAA